MIQFEINCLKQNNDLQLNFGGAKNEIEELIKIVVYEILKIKTSNLK